MWKKYKSPVQFLLGWPLSLVALFFIIKTFLPKFQEIQLSLVTLNLGVLLAGIGCFLVYYFLRSYFWVYLLELLGYKVPAREAFFLWSAAQLKRYIPGNIWGVLGMTISFAEKGVAKKDTAKAIVLENEVVIFAATLLSFLALPFLHQYNFPLIEYIYPFRFVLFVLFIIAFGMYCFSSLWVGKIQLPLLRHINHILPTFPPVRIAFLILLMTVSYIFFGVGTFLTISSFTAIDPQLMLVLIGYIVLSLVIGFLSIVTPTGLGVREGAIAFGLAKVMPLSLAGFAAIFCRIVLVITEVLFVGLMYLFSKQTNAYILKEIAFIRKHIYEGIVIMLAVLFALYFSIISILRYTQYYTGRFDLGNMAQTVWNTSQGRIFDFTNPNGTDTVSRLAFHADFILILFAPLYWIWETPKTLLVVQAVVVAAGAWFVYHIAQKLLKYQPLSLTFAFLYLLNPSVQRATLYDFHSVTMVTTFFLGAFYFLLMKRYKIFLLFVLLAGITKEQIWAIIALLGLYVALIHKQRKFGIVLFAVASLTFYLLIWQAIPAASNSEHFAVSYYTGGDTDIGPTGLLKKFFFAPAETLSTIFDKERLNYLQKLLAPLGFTSLLAPWMLIFAAPDLAINLLSSKPQLYQIYYQYTAAITPFLFISSMYGIMLFKRIYKKLPWSIVIIFLLASGLHSAYLYGPLPGSKESNLDMITKPQVNREALDKFIQNIPDTASVASTNNLGSHLSHRENIYSLPYGLEEAEYILFERSDPHPSPAVRALTQSIYLLSTNGNYIVMYDDGNVLALRKRASQ